MVVVEASGTALVASNADLTGAGGLGTDLAARFLASLADAAALTLHVRLIEGENTDHVLEAIFKALGVALADARSTDRRNTMEKTVIRTENAPAPFQGAPYNQAIRVGELVFVAGQLGLEAGRHGRRGRHRRADRAGAPEPRGHPRGGRQLARRTSSRRASSSRISATSPR